MKNKEKIALIASGFIAVCGIVIGAVALSDSGKNNLPASTVDTETTTAEITIERISSEDLAGFVYEYSDEIDGMVITSYEGEETTVVIPSEIEGEQVKEIGSWAFCACENITDVTIPYGVTTIGYSAFEDCENLKSVKIPDSVITIDKFAFEGCISLTSVTIPDSVIIIDEFAFNECENLAHVDMSENVTKIGGWAFSKCRNLKEITLGENTKEIDQYAFSFCSGLEKITMSDGVEKIGKRSFVFCSNLKEVSLPDSVCNTEESFGSCEYVVITYKGKTYTYEELENLYSDINATNQKTDAE